MQPSSFQPQRLAVGCEGFHGQPRALQPLPELQHRATVLGCQKGWAELGPTGRLLRCHRIQQQHPVVAADPQALSQLGAAAAAERIAAAADQRTATVMASHQPLTRAVLHHQELIHAQLLQLQHRHQNQQQ